jgi:hypothetical protein
VALQWVRGRTPIPGATRTTYRLGAADLGFRISARVTRTKAGYATRSDRTPATTTVRTVPRVRITLEPGRGRVRVTVRVTAPGVSPVSGTVRVRSGGKVLAEKPLRAGTRTITLTSLRPGLRTVRVRYLGSAAVTSSALLPRTTRIG